jgi:RimJ/RimL family protein N-acetyltransferase
MPWDIPERKTHTGSYVTIRPLDAERDVEQLYAAGHASSTHLYTWQYLPYGPFLNVDSFYEWLIPQQASRDPLFHTVFENATGRAVGMTSIMSIVAQFGRAELGHIWYDVGIQRSACTSEATHLLMVYLFDTLGYRRVEWKCDNRNLRSKAAAKRLGFQYEGLFRQHLIVKNQNRDTAWFSIIDVDWPVIRERQSAELVTDHPASPMR